MINRILIRIKVVQMLYSYLLTRNVFNIEPKPESLTRDKKYAYALYLDLLLFVLELSGYNVKAGRKSPLETIAQPNLLSGNKMVEALAANSDVRGILSKGDNDIENFDAAAVGIYRTITGSELYHDYKKKKKPGIKEDVTFWCDAINSIVAKDDLFIKAARLIPGFTVKGFDMGIKMFVETINNYSETQTAFADALKLLQTSLNKAYELYYCIFMLMIELTSMQRQRIEAAKNKYLPTDEDLNPQTRFIDNRFIKSIEQHPDFKSYMTKMPISWSDDEMLLKSLLDKIMESDIYAEYMSAPTSDYVADCNFWRSILKSVIFQSDEFCDALEVKSVYWNDDLPVIGTFVLKTIKQFSNADGAHVSFLPQYKDREDAEFGQKLFMESANNFDQYRSYIEMFVNDVQWDPERVAFMDMVIMVAAIAELLHFPLIPIPVTLNEYIEIANGYSTAKSGQFINGILFSVINYLKDEGKLDKE